MEELTATIKKAIDDSRLPLNDVVFLLNMIIRELAKRTFVF